MVKSLFKRFSKAVSGEHLESLTDEALCERYKMTQDTQYISELMQRYARQITAFAWKSWQNEEEVQDFGQDVFVKLAAKLQTSEVEHFKSWLYRFMQNLVHDKGRRRKLFNDFVATQEMDEKDGTNLQWESDLDNEHLKQAVESLNERERTCLEMLYFEERTYADIMQATGLTFNQVRGLKDRTLKKLRERLNHIYRA